MKRLWPRLLTCVYCSSKKKQPEGEGQVNRLLSVALTKTWMFSYWLFPLNFSSIWRVHGEGEGDILVI